MVTSDSQNMISVSALSKFYGTNIVLNELYLDVSAGEFVIINGSNGSGKTTLHLILASLLKPDAGTVEILNTNLEEELGVARNNIGYVAHDPFLYPSMTIKENLIFFAKLHNLSYENINQIYEDNNLLELLGISDKLHSVVGDLSHGYKKRVGIACSLIYNPSILLLDEPETGLDTQGFDALVQLIDLLIHMNKSVILTTHSDLSKYKTEYTHYHLKDGKLLND